MAKNNEDKPDSRSQMRVNFSPRFRAMFNDEMSARFADKPGMMATTVLKWWLMQPKWLRDMAFTATQFPPYSQEDVKKAIEAHEKK